MDDAGEVPGRGDPDPRIVATFVDDEESPVTSEIVPNLTLAVLWGIDPSDGRDVLVWHFAGVQRVSTTVGDLMAIVHALLGDPERWE